MGNSERSGFMGMAKAFGPGILFAGAAIGTSHLYWSTRAGAKYGFALIWVVLLANFFKYPFFEFCRRYTAATGESALEGYRRLGPWAFYPYFVICVFSAFVSAAGVTAVTAALAGSLFPIFEPEHSMLAWCAIIAGLSAGLLLLGRYPALDGAMKAIMIVLGLSTVAALCGAIYQGRSVAPGFEAPALWDAAGITFMVGLMGWMPTPMDAAAFPTLWAKERERQTGYRPSLRETLIDFHIGYVGSTVFAVAFLALGALVMYGGGEALEAKDHLFAEQLRGLYAKSLGPWSSVVVGVAALTCLFSTVLTVFDGYARVIPEMTRLAVGKKRPEFLEGETFFRVLLIAFVASTLFIVGCLFKSMGALLIFVTVVAFLSAPFLAFVNLRLIGQRHVPKEAAAPPWLKALGWCGLVFLTGFAFVYLYSQLL